MDHKEIHNNRFDNPLSRDRLLNYLIQSRSLFVGTIFLNHYHNILNPRDCIDKPNTGIGASIPYIRGLTVMGYDRFQRLPHTQEVSL